VAGTIELNQSDPVKGVVAESVPCIKADELLAGRTDELVDIVRNACLESGFFYVEVTSRQRDAIGATLEQMQRFFALDDEDSRKHEVRQEDSGDSGWVPRYSEPAYQPGTVSSLEAFDFAIENVADAEHNKWPRIPGFRTDVCRCWEEWQELAAAILRVVGQAFEMPDGFLEQNCSSHALSTMRLLYYTEEELATDSDVGIAAHTDFECITLLYQTAPGLELLDVNGHWLDSPVREGRIVVLLDDMLERWTNGAFKATGHRVRNTGDQRFSIVMFIAADDEIDVAPLSQFVTRECPARYEPVTQEKHLDTEIQRAKENVEAGQ
jgi:isopenicillin N synthase-like dioxygenase